MDLWNKPARNRNAYNSTTTPRKIMDEVRVMTFSLRVCHASSVDHSTQPTDDKKPASVGGRISKHGEVAIHGLPISLALQRAPQVATRRMPPPQHPRPHRAIARSFARLAPQPDPRRRGGARRIMQAPLRA